MTGVVEQTVYCPYCGETIVVLIDCSVTRQRYIEDCFVCCRPIEIAVSVDDDGEPVVQVYHENE